jgi:SAM-dependent methyltransferase
MRKWDRKRLRRLRKQAFPTARQLLVSRSLGQLDLSTADRVLVVGAGEDPYRRLFPSHKTYVCLDICPTDGVTNVVADAHQMPFLDATFNCVLASEVTEHLHNPEIFASEVHRVLAPGGTVVITVPFMFHRHADPYDFWRPTPDALRRLFSSFSSVEISAQGNRLHSMFDLLTTSFWP